MEEEQGRPSPTRKRCNVAPPFLPRHPLPPLQPIFKHILPCQCCPNQETFNQLKKK